MKLLKDYGQLFKDEVQSHPVTLQHHRPLRVGFVSADLRQHPVGYFLDSTLEQLRVDPKLSSELTLIAYHNHHIVDEYTLRLHPKFAVWHQVHDWNDARLIEQIKNDKIDILIDLSGHTTGTRLPVFAQKPAPLQVNWLGYFGSTGLSNIDYVLADPICVPANEAQYFIEKIWRLPHLRYSFSPPENAPEISPSPCLQRKHIRFGCYQSLPKINLGVLRCWAKILDASPDARIRIQSSNLGKPGIKERFIERLESAKIDTQRIDLIDQLEHSKYLASYAEVDIMLDTFPFTGGTTTAEALWMGVPTITLSLPGMLGRQGEALLVNAGLSDWVAQNEDDYIQKTIDWANADSQQRRELAKLRAAMRGQVSQSPVFNAQLFAKDFVTAMYGMWNEKFGD